ncbi:hypothetical protein PGQ11_009617 [Apiospora arundinis]|uniref:Rhodopsin domain-containing protein n=1 Tax=Apiospora arundinis TaxID=335852 RepID=A0ABR2IJG4_9PEZI
MHPSCSPLATCIDPVFSCLYLVFPGPYLTNSQAKIDTVQAIIMASLTQSARLNFAGFVATFALAVIAVTTRFAIRFRGRQKVLLTDLMCLLSTCFFIAYGALMIDFIFNVSKYHALDGNPLLGLEELVNLAKRVFAMEIVFGCGITSIKLSILWLYRHLFAIKTNVQRAIHGVAAVAIAWLIGTTLAIVFQCRPISAYWETVVSSEFCSENSKVLLGYEMTNLFIDVAILCIPLAVVPRLQLATTKKASVTTVFLLGALVCVFSILRLTAIYRPPDLANRKLPCPPAVDFPRLTCRS